MPNVTNSTIDVLAGVWTPEVTVKELGLVYKTEINLG